MTDAGAPLGNIASIASTSVQVGEKWAGALRWKNKDTAGDLLPNWPVEKCCHYLVPGKGNIPVERNSKTKSTRFKNLMTCGSVWTCHPCAAKITEKRRKELKYALDNWKGAVIVIAATLQHDRDDKLGENVDALNDALRRLKSGRWWQVFAGEFGIVSNVVMIETPWGKENGWHPHKHILIFSELPEAGFDLEGFTSRLIGRYTSILARSGHYASDLYGLDVQLGNKKAGDYVEKWGVAEEMTRSSVKKGSGSYTPFQLLELFRAGEEWAGALFVEYAHTMKGKNQITWSRGGRKAVGLGDELADDELAAQDDDDAGEYETLISLNYDQFKVVCLNRKCGELLEVARGGDPWALWDFLEKDCGVLPTWLQREALLFG